MATEVLSDTIITAFETVNAAKSSLIQKDNFNKFSTYLDQITFALKELSKSESDFSNSENFKNAIEILDMQITVAKNLTLECNTRNKIYLLLNTRKIVKRLERITKEIGRSIGLMPLSSFNVSSNLKEEISKIHKSMLDTEYQIDTLDEEILEKIEVGIQERIIDRSYVNSLIINIGESIGISTDQASLRKEFEDFKNEIQSVEQGKDMLEFIHIEQIILLLEKADVIATPKEKEKKYFSKRKSLGNQPVEPLQSFYCPITGDVMVDPVETSTGHTFERSAIEKWLMDGNNLCPLTMITLKNSNMRSNKTLKQSIEEWRDRNTMIMIASMKSEILSNEDDEVVNCLMKVEGFCSERRLYQEWVIMEDYIPILISLLCAKNFKIRERVLGVLCVLARDSDDNKETIVSVDNSIEYIVCSLARKVEESKLALTLLLELSRSNVVKKRVGNVQGCILFLVTLSSSDDTQAAKDAQELLNNLSCLDQNVVQMAKANFFGPLLLLLSTGPENVQMMMAETLSEIELTDHSKLQLSKDGAVGPLIKMLSHNDIETKKVSVKALQNLSSLPQNGLQIIKEGAINPLFEILYRHSLSLPSLREQVASTIMHLAVAIATQEVDELAVSFLKSEEDIFKFFSLISLTGPDVQQSILRAFDAICQSPSGFDIRSTLRKLSAVQVLVQLCEAENDKVRASAVKLFCSLTEDGEDSSTFLDHVNQRCIETLLKIIKTSNDGEEIVASMRIISDLPKDSHMTQFLLDSGALQVIFANLTSGSTNTAYNTKLTESATKALCHFTIPTNQEWQKQVAESGFIPILVRSLIYGTPLTKQNAAISLKQLSESSIALTTPVKTRGIFGCCWAPPETGCSIHTGICTVESSFCLLKANAMGPLTRVISEPDLGACEASLDALLTLIEGELLQKGSKVLSEANAISPIIKLLGSNNVRVQEKALKALERIFRLFDFKQKYGASAQMLLVDITQRGNTGMKSLAAKILAQLNVLLEQSSFF